MGMKESVPLLYSNYLPLVLSNSAFPNATQARCRAVGPCTDSGHGKRGEQSSLLRVSLCDTPLVVFPLRIYIAPKIRCKVSLDIVMTRVSEQHPSIGMPGGYPH